MTFTLVTTRHFERRARKFLRKHPNLKTHFKNTLEQLRQSPFEPKLKIHGLTGKLVGLQAVSITHSYRIVLTVKVTQQEIILLDISTHDEVY
ncbi:MAG: type II toxin-antitoxin system mRNA interferase toxin, RelE/StbE family [Candidatus Competibacteraceae bacterium]|nr:type II toxin-antitoxin system mRNA interferase toxin, RelE/StbE family [Candidatus Competibacteraceae bacterium]